MVGWEPSYRWEYVGELPQTTRAGPYIHNPCILRIDGKKYLVMVRSDAINLVIEFAILGLDDGQQYLVNPTEPITLSYASMVSLSDTTLLLTEAGTNNATRAYEVEFSTLNGSLQADPVSVGPTPLTAIGGGPGASSVKLADGAVMIFGSEPVGGSFANRSTRDYYWGQLYKDGVWGTTERFDYRTRELYNSAPTLTRSGAVWFVGQGIRKDSIRIYDPLTGAWQERLGVIGTPIDRTATAQLPSGEVVAAGGTISGVGYPSAFMRIISEDCTTSREGPAFPIFVTRLGSVVDEDTGAAYFAGGFYGFRPTEEATRANLTVYRLVDDNAPHPPITGVARLSVRFTFVPVIPGEAKLTTQFVLKATGSVPVTATTLARTPVMTPTTTEFIGAPPRLHLAHHLGYRSGRVTPGTRPHIGELEPLRMTMNKPFASYVDHWKGRSKNLPFVFTLFAVDKGAAAVLTTRFFFDGSIAGEVIQAAKVFLHFDMNFRLPTAGAFHIEMLHSLTADSGLHHNSNAAELASLRFLLDAYGLAGKPGLLAFVRFRLRAHGVPLSDDNEVNPIRFQFRLWAAARWAPATGDLMEMETWWGEREWLYWWRRVWGWNGYGYVYQGRVKEWYWRYKTETWPYGVVTKIGERREPFALTFTLFAAPDMYGTSRDNLMRFDQWGRGIAEYRGKAKLLLRFRYINFTGKVTSKGRLDPLLAWFDILVGDAMGAEPLDPEDMHMTFVLATRGNEYVTWLFPPRPVRIVSDVYEATGVVHEVGD